MNRLLMKTSLIKPDVKVITHEIYYLSFDILNTFDGHNFLPSWSQFRRNSNGWDGIC